MNGTLALYCGHCGQPAAVPQAPDGAREVPPGDHTRCAERLRMEPPRYCVQCRRRMKVQVTPRGWSAACVEHGAVVP